MLKCKFNSVKEVRNGIMRIKFGFKLPFFYATACFLHFLSAVLTADVTADEKEAFKIFYMHQQCSADLFSGPEIVELRHVLIT